MDKSMIETGAPVRWSVPQLTVGTRGFDTTVPLSEIVECIFHRLKTGCEWPTKQFFTHKVLGWNAVFYYYNKWSKADCWRTIWINILKSRPAPLPPPVRQPTRFDKMAPTATHRVPIDTSPFDLSSPPPFQVFINADHQRPIAYKNP